MRDTFCLLAMLPIVLSLAACGGEPTPSESAPAAEVAPMSSLLTSEQLGQFAELALACIDRPYPYKPHHVITDESSLKLPREYHPAFYGCFDWHSAVHGHWMLVRVLRTEPDHPIAPRIREALDAHLTADALAAEAAYFDGPQRRSFERPYGWAWTLRLAAELRSWQEPQAQRWSENMAPLEQAIVTRYQDYLDKLTWPIRTGVHPNTAFALSQAWDYAVMTGDDALRQLVERRARDYYFDDLVCPIAYEPSGEDFFSPCLLEADLMRRVLSAEEYSAWLDGFLPTLLTGDLGPLATPAKPSDPSDPKISHLDGLNLVRAWALRGMLSAMPEDDPRAAPLRRAAEAHTETGLGNVLSGHYEGEHWLASFGIYLATDAGILQPS